MKENIKSKKILFLGLDPSRYDHGGVLTHLPIIKTVPRSFEEEIQAAFKRFADYTHVLFTSRTAIPIFKDYVLLAGHEKLLLQKKYICIGQATALKLRENGLDPAYISSEESADGIVTLLKGLSTPIGNLFFPRSAQGRDLIPSYLSEKGILCTILDLYDTQINLTSLPDLTHYDEIVFTSPSTVTALLSLLTEPLPFGKCVAIGPVTKKKLEESFGIIK